MLWKKIGRIYDPKLSNVEWMSRHSMLPIADHIKDDIFRVYCCSRDAEGRSLVGYIVIDINNPKKIIQISENPVFSFGKLGHFDDNGVSPSSIVTVGDRKHLYYIGWKPRSTTRFGLIAGVSVSNDNGESFERISNAPILSINDKEPISILTAPFVLKMGDTWQMWYVSGVEWKNPDLPVYNIKYAESSDGINWNQTGHVCISNRDNETSLARPCVLFDEEIYKMWYSYKHNGNTYRIGYAESVNGLDWTRLDGQAGIDISESGWDSEMIEYAFVFIHNEKKYMLYNGNNYGASGFGLAIMSE
jgi:predicted GH43/DUF377 family glycosyl hydrolase